MCTMTSVTSPSRLAAAGRTAQAEERLSNPVRVRGGKTLGLIPEHLRTSHCSESVKHHTSWNLSCSGSRPWCG